MAWSGQDQASRNGDGRLAEGPLGLGFRGLSGMLGRSNDPTDLVELPFATVRLLQRVTKGAGTFATRGWSCSVIVLDLNPLPRRIRQALPAGRIGASRLVRGEDGPRFLGSSARFGVPAVVPLAARPLHAFLGGQARTAVAAVRPRVLNRGLESRLRKSAPGPLGATGVALVEYEPDAPAFTHSVQPSAQSPRLACSCDRGLRIPLGERVQEVGSSPT